jgi:hypothetical protein
MNLVDSSQRQLLHAVNYQRTTKATPLKYRGTSIGHYTNEVRFGGVSIGQTQIALSKARFCGRYSDLPSWDRSMVFQSIFVANHEKAPHKNLTRP